MVLLIHNLRTGQCDALPNGSKDLFFGSLVLFEEFEVIYA